MKLTKKTADIIMIIIMAVFLLLVIGFEITELYVKFGVVVLMIFYFIGSWTERKFGDK